MSGSNLPPLATVFGNGNGVLLDQQLNTFVQGAMLVANLRAFQGIHKQTVFLVGFTSAGDGGAGPFYYDTASTAADDGGVTCIAPIGVLVGRWLRMQTGGRLMPSTALTFYVNNVTGSNTNNGSSPGQAWRTIQHAVDVLCDQYIFSNAVTIQVQDTGVAYNEAVLLRPYIGSPDFGAHAEPIIIGETPAVTILPASGSCFTANLCPLPWRIQGLTLSSANANCLLAQLGGYIYHQECIFGDALNGAHIRAGSRAFIRAVSAGGSYEIAGDAENHILATAGGAVIGDLQTITLTGTPNFSDAFVSAGDQAYVRYQNSSFVGGATGINVLIDDTVVVLGPDLASIGMGFPGNSQGTLNGNDQFLEVRLLAGDANLANIGRFRRYISTSVPLTAPRTWSLPLANTVPPGPLIWLLDDGNINGANTITIQCQGADTFTTGGTSYVMGTAGDCSAVMSNGTDGWYRVVRP